MANWGFIFAGERVFFIQIDGTLISGENLRLGCNMST
jgi:hypothetical protein